MPEEYSGNVQGSVGNRPAPAHGGNSPIPPAGSGNRFAKGEIQGIPELTAICKKSVSNIELQRKSK